MIETLECVRPAAIPLPPSLRALLKFLCHNIVVLIQSVYELGIEPAFWGEGDH